MTNTSVTLVETGLADAINDAGCSAPPPCSSTASCTAAATIRPPCWRHWHHEDDQKVHRLWTPSMPRMPSRRATPRPSHGVPPARSPVCFTPGGRLHRRRARPDRLGRVPARAGLPGAWLAHHASIPGLRVTLQGNPLGRAMNSRHLTTPCGGRMIHTRPALARSGESPRSGDVLSPGWRPAWIRRESSHGRAGTCPRPKGR
jgi:hypothetical protein